MIKLGNTVNEIVANGRLTPELQKLVLGYYEGLRKEWPYELNADIAFMSDLVHGTFRFGGYLYLIEDTDESFHEMCMMCGCDDVRREAAGNGFDVAQYLDSTKTSAVLGMVTNPDGGSLFLMSSELLAKYPGIAFTIDHGFDWMK